MHTRLVSALALSLVLASMLVSAAPGGKNAPIPVVTILADSQNGFPLRVGSDTQGPYLDTSRTINSEIQRFAEGTDWMLTTYYGGRSTPSNRSVFFDLSEPVSAANPAPPLMDGPVQAHLIAKCRLVGVDLLKLALGTPVDCPGAFRFQADNGVWYRLAFNPENFSTVDRLRVTCQASDSAGCKIWTITPASSRLTGTDPNVKSRNTLLQLAGDDGYSDEIAAELGDYYLSFHITVTR